MVYGQIARIAAQGARAAGIYLIPRAVKTFTKYDKAIFRGLYGQSGGRGVRHGRDIGAAVGGLMATQRGDDLEVGSQNVGQYSSRPKPQAYRGRGFKRGTRSSNYYSRCRVRPSSKFRKRYSS